MEITGIPPIEGRLAVVAEGFAPTVLAAGAGSGGKPIAVDLLPGVVAKITPTGSHGRFGFRSLDERGVPLMDVVRSQINNRRS